MKTMNNRKRVSFGSKGSMVETWIIEDLPAARSSKEEEFITSLVTHSKSDPGLESRDNPFLPGGDLSKEAEELLSKATIVRDKFYLDQEQRRNTAAQAQAQGHAQAQAQGHAQAQAQGQGQPGGTSQPDHATAEPASHDGADGTLPNASNNAGVLEERISPASASKAEAGAAAPHPRENGKAGDGVAGATSPDGVRLEVGGSPTADGSKGVVSSDSAGEQQDKDKAKRRPKCCVVM